MSRQLGEHKPLLTLLNLILYCGLLFSATPSGHRTEAVIIVVTDRTDLVVWVEQIAAQTIVIMLFGRNF